MQTPGFKCGTILYSEPARIIKLPDNDNDCVTDDIDLDDDQKLKYFYWMHLKFLSIRKRDIL